MGITKNVIRALTLDSGRKQKLMRRKIPWILRKAHDQLAGLKVSERYESFVNGSIEYWRYFLRKDV